MYENASPQAEPYLQLCYHLMRAYRLLYTVWGRNFCSFRMGHLGYQKSA
jgi:hypothetical protein